MADCRVTLYQNGVPKSGKVTLLSTKLNKQSLLEAVGQRLNVGVAKLYNNSGAEIDDVRLMRDDDVIFAAEQGEQFYGMKQKPAEKGKKGSRKLHRVAVVGPGGVGKSAIILRYVQGLFVQGEYDPTIEDAHSKQTVVDNEACVLDILDTAGQEEFYALRPGWFRRRDGFVMVFGVDNRKSFEDMENFFAGMMQENDVLPPIVLVANKCDLTGSARKVTEREAHDMIKLLLDKCKHSTEIAYIETSAKKNTNIEKVFVKLIRSMRSKDTGTSRQKSSSWTKLCTIL